MSRPIGRVIFEIDWEVRERFRLTCERMKISMAKAANEAIAEWTAKMEKGQQTDGQGGEG
jgi:hypothetical protein